MLRSNYLYNKRNTKMTAQEILNLNTTKTEKMLKLFELGLTRTEVASLLNVGYGFVQNVYARRYGTRRQPQPTFTLSNEWRFERKFGIEIEAYGVSRDRLRTALHNAGIDIESESYNHDTRNHWKIVSDGSVRGENAFELVSPPLVGTEGLEQVKTVCRILESLNAQVNKTCGLHVHFDATNLTTRAWKNVFLNYGMFETEIDSIMPASRRGNVNTYCRSLANLNRTTIENGTNLRAISDSVFGSSRYYKVNCQSFWRHRTIEFRQHSGTVEYTKIYNWVMICAQLLDYSHLQTANNGSWESFKSILQTEQQEYIQQRKQKFVRVTA